MYRKTGRGSFLVGAIVVAAIFGFGSPAAAQFPLGTWDVQIKGATIGQGYLTFAPGGVLTAYGVIVPNMAKNPTETINFGFFVVDGQWLMLPNGEVVGFWQSPPAEDVRIDVSSFKATGRDGVRIRVVGESTNGSINLIGVPAVVLDDLTGSWSANVLRITGMTQARNFIFFDLTPTALLNVYDLVGFGADRCVYGTAMLSRKGKVGFVTLEFAVPDPPDDCTTVDPATDVYLRASGAVGKVLLNLGTFTGRAVGSDEGDLTTITRMDVIGP